MKFISLIVFMFLVIITINAQNTNLPDANFEQALINLGYDNGSPDGVVLTANIDTITILDVSNKNISSLVGIEDFTSISILKCNNNNLTALNITQNPNLTTLYVSTNNLSNIDVTQNSNLDTLGCSNNQLTTVDVTQNLNLIFLALGNNILTTLNVTQNTNLEILDVFTNSLTTIDLSQNIKLKWFGCAINQFSTLNLSQNSDLEYLDCIGNHLTTLNLTSNPLLKILWAHSNYLTNSGLDISNNLNLEKIGIGQNNFTSLDFSQYTNLIDIQCPVNFNLTCLNVKNGNNMNLLNFEAHFNSNLTCIEVDDSLWSTNNWTTIDAQTHYSEHCNNGCSTITSAKNYFSSNNKFTIAPNPSSGLVNIFQNNTTENFSYEIISIDGKIVLAGSSENNRFQSLDLSEQSNGMYFCKITTSKSKEMIKIIIK